MNQFKSASFTDDTVLQHQDNTFQANINYHIAYADTLSFPPQPSIGTITKNNIIPSLVSELSQGIGDTEVSKISDDDSEIETISLELPKAPKSSLTEKTIIRKKPECKASNHIEFVPPSQTTFKMNEQCNPSNVVSSELNAPIRPVSTIIESNNIMNNNLMADIGDKDISNAETFIHNAKRPSCEIDIGTVVANRYEILSQVAEGGYGVVYRARQIGIDRIVALKRLRSQQDESINQRFLLEANIIKDLIHPNTIQLIDSGIDQNHLFIVMEYIEGVSLKKLIEEEKTFSQLRAINIAKQILKSLHEAHERGIVHRDIKPSNILIRQIIGEKDFVKVLDFGIAKARFKNAPRLTQDGKILGTPQYLAPELFFGEPPTPAVDIFAVGLIICEMLTGCSPMPKSTEKLIRFAASKAPIPIPQNIINSELGPILLCALNKNPKMRYQKSIDMLNDLQHVELKLNMQSKTFNAPLVASQPLPKNKTHHFLLACAAMLFIFANLIVFYCIFG